MRRCTFCGAPMVDGVRFCGECGREIPVAPPAPPPPPVQPMMSAPPPVVAAPAAPATALPGRTVFDVVRYEMFQMPKITLNQAHVVVEAGQLHYMIGQIQMQADMPSLGGLAKSFLTKEKAVRPVYSGSGEIYLTPTFGEVNIMELNGSEQWVLDKGCYLASDAGVQLELYQNKMMNSLFGGEGMFQTMVCGVGKVFYWSPGPLQRVDLRGQTLTVDGSFAVARTASLDYRVERATKGLLGSMMSGEGLVSTFNGYGTVLIAPMSNRYMTMLGQFGSLHAAIRSISRSG